MDGMQQITLTTQKTARVQMIGTPGPNIKHLWITFHGYGQLSTYFARHFMSLKKEDVLVLVPEALNRFYTEGVFGRVGASWMTKEARLDEIADQKAFLDQLYSQIQPQLHPDCNLHILGFSQGVATMWRWIKESQLSPASFIIWAGKIPEEFSPDMDKRMNDTHVLSVHGDQDPYSNEKLIQQQSDLLKVHFPQATARIFKGKHQMNVPLLNEIVSQLY